MIPGGSQIPGGTVREGPQEKQGVDRGAALPSGRTTAEPSPQASALVGHVLHLQRTAGNAATTGIVRGLRSASRRAPSVPGGPLVQRTIGDGHDLRSNRFAGNVTLEAAFDGEVTIGSGDRGLHVTLIQQAVADTGHAVGSPGINGTYHAGTRTAVRAFQASTGAGQTGTVNADTMRRLDEQFLRHAPDRAQARDPTRTNLMEGTRRPSVDERAAFTSAITTEQRTSGGALPTFHRSIPSSSVPYEQRIRASLNASITALYNQLVTSRPARTAGNLMSGSEINGIANRAKQETDSVFGRYKRGPALAYGTNIRDQFRVRAAQLRSSAAARDSAAAWRVDKLLSGNSGIKQIDREHGAVQSRATERGLIAPIRTAIIAARRRELLAIHRNWPASAGGGQINLQRYRGTTAAATRNILYRLFNTVIHEYIHTLEHPNHVAYRSTLPEQRGGFVLREGMTDYFAKMVWDGLSFGSGLRADIEGGFQDPANPTGHPIPTPGRYVEWRNAERAAGVLGIRNVMVAFFRGRTEVIR